MVVEAIEVRLGVVIYLTGDEVRKRTGLSSDQISFLIGREEFPRSLNVWREDEIKDWLEKRGG